jgi:Na+-transporting methylmalonyl-CoA/oxaloacetate decarboxylase gamma subunit
MPYDETMGVGFLILVLVVLAPIARAIARTIERRGLPPSRSEEELKKALQLTEQRLSDSETRLAALEDRVDFYEKLLANPEKRT